MNVEIDFGVANMLTKSKISLCHLFAFFQKFIFQIRIPDSQSSKTQFGLISEDLQEQLRDILESDATEEDSKVFTLAKDHYKACMDLENLEKIGYAPLQNALKVFGGWPVLEEKWDEDQFDW